PPRRAPARSEETPPAVDSIHRAKVVSIKHFGAFCSLSGFKMQGLVHISQLAQRRVETVEDVVQIGDEVWVKVLAFEGSRLRLSMRVLDQTDGTERPDEPRTGGPRKEREGGDGDVLPELYSIHRGHVVKMACKKGDDDGPGSVFGAFVALEGFRKQGLLHVSQISNERVEGEDVESIIPVGHELYVKVPEYGSKRQGSEYAMLSDGDDDDAVKAQAPSSTYQLKALGGGNPGGADAISEQQKLQIELTAGILAKAREKKAKQEKHKKSKKLGKDKKAKKDKKVKKDKKSNKDKKAKTSKKAKKDKK
ncbi:MAG: hypothetical protein SGPRY_001237, partial [Prymnesium sp.]